MEIINAKPPIYDSACAAFQVNPVKTVFTYGDKLYNPGGAEINDNLLAHEEVHAEQQNHNDADAALWWGRYLRDAEFRVDQEARAYGAQYRWFLDHSRDRNYLHRVLMDLTRVLSGPLYGSSVDGMTAMNLIKKYAV